MYNKIAGFAESFTTNDLTFKRASGEELTAKKVRAQQLCVNKSDGTPVCVTGDQLDVLLKSTGQTDDQPTAPLSAPAAATVANPGPSPAPPPTPPSPCKSEPIARFSNSPTGNSRTG